MKTSKIEVVEAKHVVNSKPCLFFCCLKFFFSGGGVFYMWVGHF